MIAHASTSAVSVIDEKDFYARFIHLRLKLKALGAEIISVHHANHWVDVDWLPQGADRHVKPTRSTLFRLLPVLEPDETKDFMFAPGEIAGAMSLAV